MDTKQQLKKRINDTITLNAPGFTYAGGYTDSNGTIRIRCRRCGTITERNWNTLRHRHNHGKEVRCAVCGPQRELDPIKNIQQIEFGICKECGALFIKRMYRSAYCSEECARKSDYRRKDRRLKGVKMDPGITLTKVFEIDRGRCYLCGGQCNWKDIEDRGGVLIAGNEYPSIDHVMPLAKGGTHTWDNVRLAHRRCNVVKSDAPPV